MTLANYIITIIGRLFCQRVCLKGCFPFLSYFISKCNCLCLLCECERFKTIDLRMKKNEKPESLLEFTEESFCAVCTAGMLYEYLLGLNTILFQWDSVWQIAYQKSSKNELCHNIFPLHYCATVSQKDSAMPFSDKKNQRSLECILILGLAQEICKMRLE